MSQPQGRSLKPKSPARRYMPKYGRPRLQGPHALDPVSTGRRRSSLTGGNVTLLPFMTAVSLYAFGRLSGLDRFFDGAHAPGRAHNDMVVRGLFHWLPAGLALSAAAALGALVSLHLRDRFRRSRTSASVDSRALKAALANVLRASGKRPSQARASQAPARQAVRAQARLPMPEVAPAEPVARRAFLSGRLDRIEAARLRRDALAAARARAAAAGETVGHLPPPTCRPLGDALPTLPFNNRVRRRDPRGTLPPAVAAALRQEVAAQAR